MYLPTSHCKSYFQITYNLDTYLLASSLCPRLETAKMFWSELGVYLFGICLHFPFLQLCIFVFSQQNDEWTAVLQAGDGIGPFPEVLGARGPRKPSCKVCIGWSNK